MFAKGELKVLMAGFPKIEDGQRLQYGVEVGQPELETEEEEDGGWWAPSGLHYPLLSPLHILHLHQQLTEQADKHNCFTNVYSYI